MRKLLWIVPIPVLLYIIFSIFIAGKILEPVAGHIDMAADFIDSDYSDVNFKTSDGLTLKGWLFKPNGDKAIMFVPGILDNRTNGGYYGAVLTKELITNGYSILLYDPRSRGDSEGKLKVKDDYLDVQGAFEFLKSKGFKPEHIGILAYSAGATSTLEAINKIPNVGVVILDSTPANFGEVLDHILSKELSVPSFLLPGVHLSLATIYGFDVARLKPLETIMPSKNTSFLILHDEHDLSVPLSNSQKIKNRLGGRARLVVFPKGSHIETFKFNREEYLKTLFEFLDSKFK